MAQPANIPLEIDCKSVKKMLDAKADFLLVDCREADEYQKVHIDRAKLVPMSVIQDRLAELEAYKEREIVVHCHHGGRSLKVTHWLRGQGFANVKSMAGGIDEWAVEIDPKLPRY
ncbi:MAG TPA: rhodanese-like domain-containing protein [Planctomycetaceae bacterium]|nr:rhodanese-like domain-containing protein [Planctomycetaceae bacterium]